MFEYLVPEFNCCVLPFSTDYFSYFGYEEGGPISPTSSTSAAEVQQPIVPLSTTTLPASEPAITQPPIETQQINIFKFIDQRSYTGSLEYLVLFDRNDQVNKSVWISDDQLKSYLRVPAIRDLFNRFKLWYLTRRFGRVPSLDDLHSEILPILKKSDEFRKRCFSYLRKTRKFHGVTSNRMIGVYGKEKGLYWSIGFDDEVDGRNNKIITDRKVVEVEFWRELYVSLELRSRNSEYKVVSHIVGSTTWTLSEAKELRTVLETRLYKYAPIRFKEAFQRYGQLKDRPLVFLCCEASAYSPNVYSVIIISWRESGPAIVQVFEPYPGFKYGLKFRKRKRFIRYFTTEKPLIYTGLHDAYNQSMIMCIQFLARVLAGETPEKAGSLDPQFSKKRSNSGIIIDNQ